MGLFSRNKNKKTEDTSKGKTVDERNKKYRIVEDWDDLSREITAFRKSHDEFFRSSGILENSKMQSFATQPFWHACYLQKKRMQRHGITMETTCDRRDYYSLEKSIHEDVFYDGRFDINNIREEITATRNYLKNGEIIGSFEYEEIAHYYLISTKELGENKIICPNCGVETTRDDLIDGCDYCGTKFSIEDLQDRFGHYSFAEDYDVKVKKYGEFKAKKSAISPYETIRYLQEKEAREIRYEDPDFSMLDFFTNVHNKLSMIHFAEYQKQINAFSDVNLEPVFEAYKNVVAVDLTSMCLDIAHLHKPPYEIRDELQYIRTWNEVDLYELEDGRIVKKSEIVRMELVKNQDCKTKSVHSPSIMKCKGCGVSLSLLDGKVCPMCGRELNLKEHDWVITWYDVVIENRHYDTDTNEWVG